MQAGPSSDYRDFYVDARKAVDTGVFNQDLEDDIDGWMSALNEEDEEIAELFEDEDTEWVAPRKQIELLPSEFTEFAIRIPVAGDLEQFDFSTRRYLKPVYDSPARRKLLKCARQTEKSCVESTHILLQDGSVRLIKDINIGDRVVSLSEDGSHTTIGTVTWKSHRYKKPCLRIKTAQCLRADVATTHPMRVWGRWLEAGELRPGHRLASLRRGGEFIGSEYLDDDRVKFAAYMIGYGSCGPNNFGFTQTDGPCLSEFGELVDNAGWYSRCCLRVEKSRTFQISLSMAADSEPKQLLEKWGLWGCRSADKRFPDWVWGLDRRQSALFLNRLWSTDDSVKNPRRSQYEIVYSSISHQLVKDVQRLLWKFGIPSKIRENKPTLYKGSDKVAYILRVQTRPGVHDFLTAIGALGKSEGIPLPFVDPNNNRDTYPIEINESIRKIVNSRGAAGRLGWSADHSLRSVGLRETLEYPPSRRKLQVYVDFFRDDNRYDQYLVEELAEHLNTDIYWDRIESIEDIGEQWCYDISVDSGESFVVDGLITHNSTTLGNTCIAYSGINYGFKSLYVSATATQAQVFSVDRIKEPLDISPELGFLIDSRLNQNVLFKQFKNRSQIRIRYAFLNADRTRGIPADLILIDEFQDILFANVPVIEQCASHSYWKLYTYSGTPKSLDNSIEVYWANYSTQNEWMVPCDRHGQQNKPRTWFWNILGMKNIGKKGLICAKCGQPINPVHPMANWAARQPVTEENAHRVTFEGYRINQLMVPWINWQDDIIMALERYGAAKFYNEVLGLSFDSGVRPLTRSQVRACCQKNIHLSDVIENAKKCHGGVFVGIDWGTGEQESYTTIALGGYMGGEFQIFYVHRFTGEDLEPQRQLQMISKLLVAVQFKLIGADYGGGFDRNDFLQRNFGTLKLAKYQYAGSPKAKVRWQSKLGRFILHRTEIMSDIFNALKYKKIYLPNWEEFATPHGDDLLNIFSEYNDQLNMIQYKLSPGKSDDTFHAILYCFLASMLVKPRPDIIIPLHAGHVDFQRP